MASTRFGPTLGINVSLEDCQTLLLSGRFERIVSVTILVPFIMDAAICPCGDTLVHISA